MALFGIHFICLVNPGDGDGFMSSEFQATLNSKGMQDVPADVVLGSRVSIRHHNTQGGYLHSHNHMYPTGSKQQQITLYPHKDDNNIFLLENQTQPLGPDGQAINGTTAWDNIDPTYLKDGDTIRLFHATTSRRLHSHDVRPPITEADWQNEVSAYGYEGFEGDANDLFRVEIQKSYSEGEAAKTRVRTIQSKFRLIHVMTGCALFSHKTKLPDWGFEQQEVTCAKQGTLPNSIWYIESNDHPKLGPNAEKVNYRNPGFLGKFWELQQVMWRTNAGLLDSHAWDSRPPSWPILSRGINFWGKNHRQIYLIGNPVIWWSSTLAILTYLVFKGIAVLRWQRGFKDYKNVEIKRFDYEIGPTVLGWAFHYFPFFLMSRQLFLHHYFPALYFAIITLCQIFDFGANRFSSLGIKQRPAIGKGAMVLFLCLSITAFTLYAPLSYGNPWTKTSCSRVKIIGTWDWDCNNFLDDYAAYANINENASSVAQTSAASSRQLVDPQAEEKAREAVSMSAEKLIKLDGSVEYRDDKGNLIDENKAKEFEGKGSLTTRTETKTAKLGADGHIINPVGQDESVAPPHPDADSGTKGVPEKDAQKSPPNVSPGDDIQKEQSVEKAKADSAKPASEANEATKAGA